MRKTMVLVVDDDSAILETLRSALEDAGYRVQTAVDGTISAWAAASSARRATTSSSSVMPLS